LGAEDYDYYGWVTSIGYSETVARNYLQANRVVFLGQPRFAAAS